MQVLLVLGAHFEKHCPHKQTNTGWACAKSSINHTLHLSAEEAISCGRVTIGLPKSRHLCEVFPGGECVGHGGNSRSEDTEVGKCLRGGWFWDELREVGMEREWPERRQEGGLVPDGKSVWI